MKARDKRELASHMAHAQAARAAFWAVALFGVGLWLWHGIKGLGLGLVLLGLARLAKPGPSAHLDKATGRDSD